MHMVQMIQDIGQRELMTRPDDLMRPLYSPDRYVSPIDVFCPLRNLAFDIEGPPGPQQSFPALLMEYTEYGDLSQFILKVIARKERIPNQLLIHFFFCRKLDWTALPYSPASRLVS